ncbi:heme peroxidase [Fusarium flagelliforme]|uniref:heme peroxidase n=1 Tax=Fusarium flagelliforme TaxID=2675880 RepID=UPI001E8D0691|nr:heme peroxidase [Fusarium flagelliforme]KAH7173420.1 heme peroxidase [Fusarium flagelliforme]
MKGTTVALALAPLAAAKQLVWPSKYDYVEDLQNNLGGYNKRGFMDAIISCDFGNGKDGQQNSAEWIRTAFHDAVTHDKAAGTGGIDASIFWELARTENKGDAFLNTFGFFSGYHNQRGSVSDLIALGTVIATGGCGGPQVPFRAGRVDAYKAGPAGVPETHTNLKDTFARFTKAGFTKEDMTALVACGHAVGGVHHVDHPEITGHEVSADNYTSVPFQTNFRSFNNGVATEYLSGKTKNPLIVAKNATLRSDKRIFDNDKATMKKLATKEGFNKICPEVFARMIDTVPKSVKLTEVIDPYEVKPYINDMSLDSKGKIHFAGAIRLLITKEETLKLDEISAKLIYVGRDGKKVTLPLKQAIWQGGRTLGTYHDFVNYEFDTTIDTKNGITKFWVQVTKKNAVKTYDNQGTGGYPVDDTVLYQQQQSCIQWSKLPAAPMKINAFIRDGRAKDPLTLTIGQKVPIKGVEVPQIKNESARFKATGKKSSGYTAFQAEIKVVDQTSYFDIVLGGKTPAGVEFRPVLPLDECK